MLLTLSHGGLLVEAEGLLGLVTEEEAWVPDAQGKDGEDDESVKSAC